MLDQAPGRVGGLFTKRSGWGGVGGVEDDGALLADSLGSPVVKVGGCVEPDAGVAVLVVVPAEEPAAVGLGVFEAAEPVGKSGPYLRVRNWLSL